MFEAKQELALMEANVRGHEPVEIDLTDPQTYHDCDMHQVWRQIRTERPVFWHGGRTGFWVISRYHDNAAIYRNNKQFTAVRGNMLATLLNGGDPAGGRMVSVSDGKYHKELRSGIFKALSPSMLASATGHIQQFTHRLMMEAIAERRVDFAERVASRVPINTICDILGVPNPDRSHMLSLSKQAVSSDSPGQMEMDARSARTDILSYLHELADRRRSEPAEDLISVLAKTGAGGDPLSSYDIALNAYSLLLGGDQTSRLSMISAVHAFATYPDEWERVRRGDVDLDTAAEEVIRWATPIMHIGRTATENIELNGQRILAGDVVTLWNSSANRDETVFDLPDRFDVGRTPNRHLAFGLGPHFCVGSVLARAEIKALLDCLRSTVSSIEVDGSPGAIFSNVVTGFATMPVALNGARARHRPM